MNNKIENLKPEVVELMLRKLDGTISIEELSQLEKYFENPNIVQTFVKFMTLCTGLHRYNNASLAAIEPEKPVSPFLEAIERDIQRREEREAQEARQAAEIKKEEVRQYAEKKFEEFKEEERRRQEKLAYKQYRARQRNLILGISSLSAILIFVVVAWLFSPKLEDPAPVAPPIVATITETQNAQWDNPQLVVKPGTQLTASPMKLRRGLVKIAFDDGAEVILQAPCRFTLEDTNQMYLQSGNLAAVVPECAQGFTVRTPVSTVVDYGTEFGVSVFADGETEAHVFKGEVDLRSGSDARVYEESRRIKTGWSCAVDRDEQLSCKLKRSQPLRFLRAIPNEQRLSLPGKRLGLADVIGGGNGFGNGFQGQGIDPITGFLVARINYEDRENKQYTPVPELLFVDGVFVPDGGEGPIVISSTGLNFENGPDTNGMCWADLSSSNLMMEGAGINKVCRMYLGGREYGGAANPLISMHTNLGVTFDLDAIRRSIPTTEIIKFTARIGVAKPFSRTSGNAKSDFRVLLDGQLRFSRMGMSPRSGVVDFQVDITAQDRFLTLMTTDGGGVHGYDWCVFAEPVLELTEVSESI